MSSKALGRAPGYGEGRPLAFGLEPGALRGRRAGRSLRRGEIPPGGVRRDELGAEGDRADGADLGPLAAVHAAGVKEVAGQDIPVVLEAAHEIGQPVVTRNVKPARVGRVHVEVDQGEVSRSQVYSGGGVEIPGSAGGVLVDVEVVDPAAKRGAHDVGAESGVLRRGIGGRGGRVVDCATAEEAPAVRPP